MCRTFAELRHLREQGVDPRKWIELRFLTAVDVHGQFTQFCAECGIACSATLSPLPPLQGGLFDEV
jgi:hypothetical protein